MPTISNLVLEFRSVEDAPKEDGLKFAVFKILQYDKVIGHDWGFANYEGGEFEKLEEGIMTGIVVKWAELPTTKILF